LAGASLRPGRERLLLERECTSSAIELHDAIGGRIRDAVAEDCGTVQVSEASQSGAEARPVENVVAEDEAHVLVADVLLTDEERLRQAVGARLNLVRDVETEAGAGNRQWRAYLSSSGKATINARDRIGKGPWVNAKGEQIAKDVDDLHANSRISKQTGLDEKGAPVNGRGDTPNRHDILTGSSADGRAIADKDLTCGNWTQSGEGSAMVGHHDRQGLRDDDASKSWNSSHPSRGCSQEALRSSGGDGLFYCFAVR